RQHRARFRGVPLAVQRALGVESEGVRQLREELQDRPANAAGTGGQDQEVADVQQGLRHDRADLRRATAAATSCTSGATATPRAITRTCGLRCWRTMRSAGSRNTVA